MKALIKYDVHIAVYKNFHSDSCRKRVKWHCLLNEQLECLMNTLHYDIKSILEHMRAMGASTHYVCNTATAAGTGTNTQHISVQHSSVFGRNQP